MNFDVLIDGVVTREITADHIAAAGIAELRLFVHDHPVYDHIGLTITSLNGANSAVLIGKAGAKRSLVRNKHILIRPHIDSVE